MTDRKRTVGHPRGRSLRKHSWNRETFSGSDALLANIGVNVNAPKHRIVFINRSFWPDVEATGQLLTELCESLSHQFDVHVVCGQPNRAEVGQRYRTSGIQKKDRVTIHRLEHHRFDKKNPLGRILSLLSFYRAAKKYVSRGALKADVVISETDPFLLPILGANFAERIGAAHVVYLQDIYPDVAAALGKGRFPMLQQWIRRRLRTAYLKADRIIVLGRCMQQRLTSHPWNLPAKSLRIVPNWADCRQVRPVPHVMNAFRTRHGLDDSFVVMHSGNMGLTQRLDVLLQATAEDAWPDRAKLLLVGNGASRDRLMEQLRSMDVPSGRVQFLDYQPKQQLAESLSSADLHVVSMHENVTGCLCPSKLYGIMAAGRNVLAIADKDTELCQTVSEHDIGVQVSPGSSVAIAQAVAFLEGQMASEPDSEQPPLEPYLSHRARLAALQRFDRDVVAKRFVDVLREVLPQSVDPIPVPHILPPRVPTSTDAVAGV